MNDSSTWQRLTSRDWRALVRRRWPVAAVALVVLLLGAWALFRHGGGAHVADANGSANAEEATKGPDVPVGAGSVVSLDSTALRLADIEIGAASSPGTSDLVANGTITYDANHVSVVSPRAEGRVSSVRADLGQRVQPGAVLAILESADIGQTRGDVERAQAALDVAKQTYEREKSLYEQQVSSQRAMLEAQAAYRSAQADYNAARSRMRALGAAGGASDAAGGTYALVSPVAGTVVERNAMPGQIAGPATNLFTVADLGHVWINADVYESDVRRVRTSAPATVVTRAMPGEVFRGRVTYAGGVVDTSTRTLKVRVEVDNLGQRLRPGMYAEVRIEAPTAAGGPAAGGSVLVPELAVQDLNGKPVVFVPEGPPGRFVARAVTVGPRTGGGLVTVMSGLQLGERVVVKGAFLLKSELMKSSFGGDES
jgi:cobalt-zinc-cadmium efflux system membrane fusion protein